MNRQGLPFIETLVIAVAGAIAFLLLTFPLPWLLGPLTAVLVWRLVTGRSLYWPIQLRNVGLTILGYMLGSSFSRETALQMVHHLPSMLFATLFTSLFSILLGLWVAKAANVNAVTGIFGGVPGGLSQMVAISEEVKGVNETAVTIMQTIRVLAVIFIVPFLAIHGLGDGTSTGAEPIKKITVSLSTLFDVPWTHLLLYIVVVLLGVYVGKKLHFPAVNIIGPLVATAAVIVATEIPAPTTPTLFVTLSQLLVGSYIGLLMKPENLKSLKKLTIYSIISSFILVCFSFVSGYVLTLFTPMSLTTGFLSTAPGGIAEMGVTAMMVGADLSMISGYQLFRIFFVLLVIPPLLKWWTGKKDKKENQRSTN